jgi:hypothetical protein
MARKRKPRSEIETSLQVTPARRGRPKGKLGDVDVTSTEAAEIVKETSGALMQDAGYTAAEVEFQDLQLISMSDMGIKPTTAGRVLGIKPMQVSRTMKKLRTNARFRQKVEALRERLKQNYINHTVATLPVLAEIEQKALNEYKSDPKLAIEKPKLLRDLRTVAGAQLPDGAVVQNTVNTVVIEQLQALIKAGVD